MNKATAVIADDEAELRNHLVKILKKLWPELSIVGQAKNGLQAVELVEKLEPDIAFLDIKMPGKNGIEVARTICRDCMIVFITAYDQYAVDAFENEALDYILKPVQTDRLSKTISRCQNRLGVPDSERKNLPDLLEKLEKSLIQEPKNPYLQWIRAQHGDTVRLIPAEEVLLFKSGDKYTQVLTAKSESLIRKPLKELEEELDPDKFWKIHRSSIVNVSAISKISKSVTGKYVIKLNHIDEPLTVSRSYIHLFKQM